MYPFIAKSLLLVQPTPFGRQNTITRKWEAQIKQLIVENCGSWSHEVLLQNLSFGLNNPPSITGHSSLLCFHCLRCLHRTVYMFKLIYTAVDTPQTVLTTRVPAVLIRIWETWNSQESPLACVGVASVLLLGLATVVFVGAPVVPPESEWGDIGNLAIGYIMRLWRFVRPWDGREFEFVEIVVRWFCDLTNTHLIRCFSFVIVSSVTQGFRYIQSSIL